MAMKIISPLEFEQWLRAARKGDRLSYYLGYLCHDRGSERQITDTQKVWVSNEPVDKLAKAVWEAYENRKVLLVQEKITQNVYSYIAVRTGRAYHA